MPDVKAIEAMAMTDAQRHRRDDRRGRKRPSRRLALGGRHRRDAVLRRRAQHDPAHPDWPERDRFILSKGHAAPVLYAALAEAGYFGRDHLTTLRKLGSMLQGHPDSKKTPGVEVSTGSLGQGLSIAAGLAAGLRGGEHPEPSRDDRTVFCLLGDGEIQEGQVWEAAMFAAHERLDNLVAIVDHNGLQIDGACTEVMCLGTVAAKFSAFDWHVDRDRRSRRRRRSTTRSRPPRPTAAGPRVIVAHTDQGQGRLVHGGRGRLARQGAVCRAGRRRARRTRHDRRERLVSNKATREALGETLVELANEGVDVVAVEADLSKSTTTTKLGDAYPERLFNVGIAEANMIDVAAGLAVAGKVAFTGSFAVFATGRAYDQIRNTVCYSNLNVKLTPTHAGITVGPDGGSHQMIEDLALMRVLPGMRVLVPADYNAAKAAIRAPPRRPGPFYVRLGRAARPSGLPRRARVRARQGQRAARGHRRDDRRVRRDGRRRRSRPPDLARRRGHLGGGHRRGLASSRIDAETHPRERAQDRRGGDLRGAQHHRRARLGGRRGARRERADAR